jgi:hypothetical protein
MRSSQQAVVVGCLAALGVLTAGTNAQATKYAGEFLAVGVNARAMGMGGAFAAVADDASAVFWNPAGLALIDRRGLLPEHCENFGGAVTYDDLAYVHPHAGERPSAFGILGLRLAVQDVPYVPDGTFGLLYDADEDGQFDPGTDIWDVDESKIRLKTWSESALFLSYGREVSPGLSVGGTLKPIRKAFAGETCFGFGADLGVLLRSEKGISVGVSLQDFFGTILSWSTGTRETITPSAHIGVAYRRDLPSVRTRVLLAGQTDLRFEGRDFATQLRAGQASADFRAGLECTWRDLIALRLGSAEGNFTAGAGLSIRGYWVDYAFLGHEYLDNSHRVSVRVHF